MSRFTMTQEVRSFVLACVCAAALTACGDDSESGDSTPAAKALTNAVSFEEGRRVPGSMPPTTQTDVTVKRVDDAETIDEAALLRFEASLLDARNDGVVAALFQFEGADAYFEVPATSSSEIGHVELFSVPMTTSPDVCDTLCEQTFNVGFKHAVKLQSGAIGKHGSSSLALDCRPSAGFASCSGGNEPQAGTGTGAAGSGSPSASCETRFNALALRANYVDCANDCAVDNQQCFPNIEEGVSPKSTCGDVNCESLIYSCIDACVPD